MAMTAAGLTGCENASVRKKQAAEALEQKYHEKFEVTDYRNAGFMADYYTVQAYADEYPDILFEASVDIKSGNVMDSYVTKRLCDRLSDKISQNLGVLENDYFVFTEAMLGDTLLTDPMVSLEDYMKDGPNKFTIYLCMNQENANIQNIAAALGKMLDGITGIGGSIAFYLMDSELMQNVQEYVTSHDDTYGDFDEMVEDAYIGSTEFENGSFYLAEDALREMAGGRL